MAEIILEQVDKTYPNGHVAARAVDLRVEDGELMVLVGPSGSGKSTIMRMIAGLELPTGGRIVIDGRDVTTLPPQQRDVAMVFQSYALYPHMTVRQNLEFGLRMRKTPRAEIDRRVRDASAALGLDAYLDRKPAQLSGGQRQRVALGRAIVREPRAFLLDEPLSNLDARMRVETRAELARLHRRLRATMVYVTHDQVEAMTLGDRVAVLRDGVLQQVAAPMELYHRPANRFVGGFIGSPGMSFVEGEIAREGGRLRFRGEGVEIALDAAPAAGERRVAAGFRPHDVRVVADGEDGIAAEVLVVEQLGSEQVVHLSTAGGARFAAVAPPDLTIRGEQEVRVRISAESLHFFRLEDGARVA